MKDFNNAELVKHLPIVTIHPDQALATVKKGIKEGSLRFDSRNLVLIPLDEPKKS